MFAGTVLLGFSLRPETYNALADIWLDFLSSFTVHIDYYPVCVPEHMNWKDRCINYETPTVHYVIYKNYNITALITIV
jgi:hypothetical protein